MGTLARDFLHGLRLLRREPLVSVVVCVTVAAGIAATTTAFALLNAFFFAPLPFAQPEQLVHVGRIDPSVRGLGGLQRVSVPDFVDFGRSTRALTRLEAYTYGLFSLAGSSNDAERTEGASVTPGMFALLGTAPAIGRPLNQSGDTTRAPEREIVLSDSLWRGRFGGGNPIGSILRLDGVPYTIVGVMPAAFEFPMPTTRFWIPMTLPERAPRDAPALEVVGRLRPGVTLAQARADLDTLSRNLERDYPGRVSLGVRVVPIREGLLFFFRVVRALFILLLAAAVFVLLIACTTVSGLLLARGSRRAREMAVRVSLGATRRRLVAQLLAEHLVLAIIGGAIGVTIAVIAAPVIERVLPPQFYRAAPIAVDRWSLLVAVVASVVSTLLFGLGPALHVTKASAPSLHEAGKAAGEARHWRWFRGALVVGEVAACVLLLSSAGLMLSAVYRMQHAPLGFDPDQVLTARVSLKSEQADGDTIMARQRRVLQRAGSATGVEAAALVSPLAFTFDVGAMKFMIPERKSEEKFGALAVSATAGYFSVMRVPLKGGRLFADDERARVVVINEIMAARFWPGQNAIGQHLTDCTACADVSEPLSQAFTIVGIVGDARQLTPWQPPEPTIYVPLLARPHDDVTLAVRTAGNPAAFGSALRGAVADADPRLAVWDVRTMRQVTEASTRTMSVATMIVGLLGSVALALVILSLYGLLSTMTSQRTKEIGVRIALGARAADIVTLVMRRSVALTVVGLIIGELASIGVLRLLSAFGRASGTAAPVGMPGSIAAIFVAAAAGFLTVALVACAVPALKAAHLDPARTLRDQ